MSSASTCDLLELHKYGRDLTDLAKKGKLEVVDWRGEQIDLVMQILCKRRNNIPILLGTPGIGISLIVEAFARRIAYDDSAPSRFKGKKVISVEEHQVNERLEKLIDLAKKAGGNVIFFVKELEILKKVGPIMEQCIGALTRAQYEKLVRDDTTLRERVRPVDVSDPSIQEVHDILKVLSLTYEAHHNVHYADEALVAAATLSTQSTGNGSLLDKALDIIDQVGAHASLETSGVGMVTEMHISKIIPSKPVPVDTLEKSKKILEIEGAIRKHIIGQEKAVTAVSRALLRARVGLKDPKRPIASFIFTGSTGVGKTELANAVAIEQFGSLENMIRLDMSEFAHDYTVSKLYGSPPGYVGYEKGGQLTNAVKRKPNSVILFDEIEKAHPDVYDGLLQILEDGRLTDGQGKTFDFSRTIIIMTSNLAHKLFSQSTCSSSGEYHHLKLQVVEELKTFFRPEFLNRLDDVIMFDNLSHDDLSKILKLMLRKVYKRVKEKYNITVKTKNCVKKKLIEEGYDPTNGARPLRRCITRVLEDRLAQWIADEQVKGGETIVVDLKDCPHRGRRGRVEANPLGPYQKEVPKIVGNFIYKLLLVTNVLISFSHECEWKQIIQQISPSSSN